MVPRMPRIVTYNVLGDAVYSRYCDIIGIIGIRAKFQYIQKIDISSFILRLTHKERDIEIVSYYPVYH